MTITIKPPPPQEAQLKYPCAVQAPYTSLLNGKITKKFIMLAESTALDITDGRDIKLYFGTFQLNLWVGWELLPSGTEIIFTQP